MYKAIEHTVKRTNLLLLILGIGLTFALSACESEPTAENTSNTKTDEDKEGEKDKKKDKINCEEECPCECDKDDKTAKKKDDEEMPGTEPYALVFAGNVKVTEGKLEEDAAKDRITKERLDLRECYAPALKKDAELKGEMEVQFTVSGSTGKIIAALVRESTLKDKDVQSCVEKEVKSWEFPKTKDGKESVVKFTTVMLAASL